MNGQRVDSAFAAQAIRIPSESDDKYSRGVVGLATGSDLYPGAGLLSTAGAIRSGVGMVRYLGAAKHLVLNRFPEAVLQPGQVQSAVIGCGWGEDLLPAASKLTAQNVPVIVDAGALYVDAVMAHADVITPHHGEAARLLGIERTKVDEDPLGCAQELSKRFTAIVVLKASKTLIVEGERCVWYEPRSHWGATAGAGDVLAGVIGAVVAQGIVGTFSAAAAGVFIHGESAANTHGPTIALDIADRLQGTITGLLAKGAKA